MATEFKNILIPVDFSINTEIAVKKAIELAKGNDTIVHLLHVVPAIFSVLPVETFFPDDSFRNNNEVDRAGRKLVQWKNSIIEMFPDICIEIHLMKGYFIQQQITRLAKRIHPQLIIVGKHHHHNWFNFLNTVSPNKLAKITHCPVLIVRTGMLNGKIRSIVFPVQTFVPAQKIDMLITLATRYRAKVFLVILVNPSNEAPTPLYNAFIDTYRLLTTSINRPVDYEMVAETNVVKASIDFAESIKADMVLISPEPESRISLLTETQVSEVVKNQSRKNALHVLH